MGRPRTKVWMDGTLVKGGEGERLLRRECGMWMWMLKGKKTASGGKQSWKRRDPVWGEAGSGPGHEVRSVVVAVVASIGSCLYRVEESEYLSFDGEGQREMCQPRTEILTPSKPGERGKDACTVRWDEGLGTLLLLASTVRPRTTQLTKVM